MFRRAAERGDPGWRSFRRLLPAALAVLVALPLATHLYHRFHGDPAARIENPLVVPASMQGEGGGPGSPFFPSSARTNVGGIIPSNFFMDSATCGECHKDIYKQWNCSAHHFASFNNQFYRKSIEYMQDVIGPQPSKWCAGCHDHAVFFNGRFERPIKDQIDTAEAHAGLACTSCHAIVHVDSSMGNGDFTIEYPPLHELATQQEPGDRQTLDHFMTYLNPEPHRRTFLKPFMTASSAEFCSSCHKVHLDVPVNSYRWFRGFNDYDNWQASGVSGQGARSFYYPTESQTCISLPHARWSPRTIPATTTARSTRTASRRANMALAFVNQDTTQLERTEKFLTSGFITVDIFAVSPEDEDRRRDGDGAPRAGVARRQRAAGEDRLRGGRGGRAGDPAVIREVGKVAAPIDVAGAERRRRARRSASTSWCARARSATSFPGGTMDAFDVWLELQATRRGGQGGLLERHVGGRHGGKGPVEPGAHFYRTYQLDGTATRSTSATPGRRAASSTSA